MYYHVWFVTKYRKATLEGEIEKFVKDIFAECIQRHKYRVSEWGISSIFGQSDLVFAK